MPDIPHFFFFISVSIGWKSCYWSKLKDTARYAGLLLARADGFGLWQRAFFGLLAKKDLIMLYWPIFGRFWCLVVTLVTLSNNPNNFKKIKFFIETNPNYFFKKSRKSKKPKKLKKIIFFFFKPKLWKIFKNPKKKKIKN